MKKLTVPLEFNGCDVEFLAFSVVYMEAAGRAVNPAHIAGNMSEQQRKSFYERLNHYRNRFLDTTSEL